MLSYGNYGKDYTIKSGDLSANRAYQVKVTKRCECRAEFFTYIIPESEVKKRSWQTYNKRTSWRKIDKLVKEANNGVDEHKGYEGDQD